MRIAKQTHKAISTINCGHCEIERALDALAADGYQFLAMDGARGLIIMRKTEPVKAGSPFMDEEDNSSQRVGSEPDFDKERASYGR